MPLSQIITVAVAIAVAIVVVMMLIGALGITSAIVRYLGFAVACVIGYFAGLVIHGKYVAR
jgi:hypothetical protein